ncbi:hypothetical protein CEXT_163681 [Caerostris extrusa]|uniref:Uncharacterized protein n=1 Tax=Caerostris extrusa TaxID=172846 RepID=A0AAV4RHA1_CAEEX|nr:hypothetical protein CEXT_163681 [Caerostris extrusa]
MDNQTLLRLAHSDPKIKKNVRWSFCERYDPRKPGHYRSFIMNTNLSTSIGLHWQAVFFLITIEAVFSFVLMGPYPIEFIRKIHRSKFHSSGIEFAWSYKPPKQHLLRLRANLIGLEENIRIPKTERWISHRPLQSIRYDIDFETSSAQLYSYREIE